MLKRLALGFLVLGLMLAAASAERIPGPHFPPESIYKGANASMIQRQAATLLPPDFPPLILTAFRATVASLKVHDEAVRDPRLSCPWDPQNVTGLECYANISLRVMEADAVNWYFWGRVFHRAGYDISDARNNLTLALIHIFWEQQNRSLYTTELSMAEIGFLRNNCDNKTFPYLPEKCGDVWTQNFSEYIKWNLRASPIYTPIGIPAPLTRPPIRASILPIPSATASEALRYVYT